MKNIKCSVCGTENKEGVKYCRICFSRLSSFYYKTSLKTDFYSTKIIKHKNVFSWMLILLLIFIIFMLIN
ncbi:MAG: hypothetical protein ABDH23_06080 [Endomicrobiia bacterium]